MGEMDEFEILDNGDSRQTHTTQTKSVVIIDQIIAPILVESVLTSPILAPMQSPTETEVLS
jgi:hypothetical protein